jgi:hypothetical protein
MVKLRCTGLYILKFVTEISESMYRIRNLSIKFHYSLSSKEVNMYNDLFPSEYPSSTFHAFSSLQRVLHAPFISSFYVELF